jgi:hypothetical protein
MAEWKGETDGVLLRVRLQLAHGSRQMSIFPLQHIALLESFCEQYRGHLGSPMPNTL